ncbi:hypothetical protein BV20DRAFT_933160 [Pilatotrama ljubarskyi]|nr:hypothetical protein BV20DRAFT_933160 [Pilatotrama ljubarskyi]
MSLSLTPSWQFQEMYLAHKSQLTAADLHHYEGRLDNYKDKLTVLEFHLTSSRESLDAYRPHLRLLGRAPGDVGTFTRPLGVAVPQRQNAIAAKPFLALLARLETDRSELQDQLGEMVAMVGAIFMTGGPLTAEDVAQHLAKFVTIRAPLEEQVPEQNELIAALQEVFDQASSTPATLRDAAEDDDGTLFSVADLRKAYAIYADIYDAIDKMREVRGVLTSVDFVDTREARSLTPSIPKCL